MTQIKYGTIVPLIGGENFGIMNTLDGQLPEWICSYSPFKNNDSHYLEYIKGKGYNGDYVFLDEQPDYNPSKVDVVNAVCPCAGLSSFSTTSSPDSATNEWMYRTAEFVLGTVKPKVFWGENAPRLSSHSGRKVADRLYEIGRENGYSLNLYYTESRLHGLSQKRPRTFYFFTQGDVAPIMPWYSREPEDIENILKMPTIDGDPMNVYTNSDDPKDDAWVAYNMAATNSNTISELYEKFEETVNLIVHSDGGYNKSLPEVAEWMDANGHDRTAKRARSMQAKLDDNKGYWAHGVTLPKGKIIPSLIGAMPYSLINPFTGKYLTLRDCLRFMKMPEDFNLASEKPLSCTNHICQNVPVTTAADMMKGVILYLEGKTMPGDGSYIKQNNKNKNIERLTPLSGNLEPSNTADLDSFFNLHKSSNRI